ncbi:MAG: exodeoxyribonuclease VII small subunit [Desulfobacteraceae bacterium]|nr:MAG: exodeoxyribonuclease VII small subunit [Desulfobacteraceae bacterium]
MTEKKFEQAMQKLETIVENLEKGELSLEDSLKEFEEGMNLAQFCSKKLEEAEQKVAILVKEGQNRYAERPFEEPDQEESA